MILKKIKIAFALILGLGFSISSCSEKSNTETQEKHHEEANNLVELTKAQYNLTKITLGKIEKRQINGTIKVNGVLDVPPQQLVSISVPMGGFLKSTDLLQGSSVKKGQVIARIENMDFIQIQQDYLDVKGQLEFTKADYERQQSLATENINAEKTLQQSKSIFISTEARFNGLREKLKMLNISFESLESGKITNSINLYAPISGYVTQVNVNIGKFVNPSDILFEIVDTEHLHAELIVFEKDIQKIKIGQRVRFTLANETNERTAKVYLIGREINADRTVQIHCHIDREDTNLLPGMYLKAIVESEGVLANAIPDEALVDFQGKKYIFVVSSGVEDVNQEGQAQEEVFRFKILEVQIGNTESEYTEIITLEETNFDQLQLVTHGAYDLLSVLKNSEEGGYGH